MIRRAADGVPPTSGWFVAAQTFIVSASGVAFVMMVCGMLAALVVGFSIRIYEILTGTGSGKTTSLPQEQKKKRRRAA